MLVKSVIGCPLVFASIGENGAGSGVGVLATFAYDDLGRRTSLTFGNGAVTTYGYDTTAARMVRDMDCSCAGTSPVPAAVKQVMPQS